MTAIYVTPYIYQTAQTDIAVYATYEAEAQEDTEITDQNGNEPEYDLLDEIISKALQFECVSGARAFEWNGTVVVATLTAPFYLKSERDSARAKIEAELNEAFESSNIIVTFDMHVYRNIRKDMTDRSMEKLYEMVQT